MKTKFLMIQGTGSHVGKSVITAALCRIFSDKGLRVAPFKAQNMALNSAVTTAGHEVGRSTALQAKAARAELTVEMNPVLLKPTAEKEAQLILNGKPWNDVSAFEQYHGNLNLRDLKWKAICESLALLEKSYDLIVIEGAGSPAEVNLRKFDVVNMAVARHTNAVVILVTDIDRGGSLASLVGTLALLPESEAALVKGFIFNKFRGDQRLFDPAISFLEEKTGRPTLGVIPFQPELDLSEEDALRSPIYCQGEAEIDIAVIHHPTLSNFTDLDPLMLEPGVQLRFVKHVSQLGEPDAVILPGSKNTGADLQRLYQTGLAEKIIVLAGAGKVILGICGGYQMLGKKLYDPNKQESIFEEIDGLGLLEIVTDFKPGKTTAQMTHDLQSHPPFFPVSGEKLSGYKIHSGQSRLLSDKQSLFARSVVAGEHVDGAINASGFVIGTALHGLFENDCFRRRFVNILRDQKSLPSLDAPRVHFSNHEDQAITRWARFVEDQLDMAHIEALLNNQVLEAEAGLS